MCRTPAFRSRYVTWLTGGLLVFGCLYGLNFLLSTTITWLQTLVLTGLYLTAHRVWLEVFWCLSVWRFWRAGVLLGAMVMLSGPAVYLVVYGLLPYLDQPLHRADVDFDLPQYVERLIKGMVVTMLSAMVVHIWRAVRWKERQRKAGLQSHFVRNLITLHTSYGGAHQGPKAGLASQYLMELIEYTLWVGQKEPMLVDWRREWTQLVQLAALLEIIHDKCTLVLEAPSRPTPGLIPPLVWLTLVENALIHGDQGPDRPIRVVLRNQGGQLYFHCANHHSPLSRRQGGTGEGLSRIRRQLSARYPENAWALRITDNGTCFHVTLMTGQPQQYLMR